VFGAGKLGQNYDGVIATVAQPLMGFKRGRRVFTRELPILHRPELTK